jgi:two-component system response regulator NreC
MITIVLADDHRIVRQGVKTLLERESDLQVVGEAEDGQQAVHLVEQLAPRVLIVDIGMPGVDGLDVLREVRRSSPATSVVVLSMHSDEAYVREALIGGASAYVLKSAGAGELLDAVRHAIEGRRYLSAPLSDRAIEAYALRARDTAVDPYELLTAREREVLQLAAEGHANAEIGVRLSISPRTVEVHRANAMHKLGLRGFGELMRYALRRGLISAE